MTIVQIETTTILLFLLASGLSAAQTAPGDRGVSAIVRDARLNTNEVSSAQRTKLRISAQFVRLPESEAAHFWSAVLPANSAARQVGMATLSDMDAERHRARWKALPGTSLVTQLSVIMFADSSVEISQSAGQTQAGIAEPGAFLQVTPRMDTNDNRRIHLAFSAGCTNSSSALPVVAKFSGSASLWDTQTAVVPSDSEKQSAEAKSGPRLLLMVRPVIIND